MQINSRSSRPASTGRIPLPGAPRRPCERSHRYAVYAQRAMPGRRKPAAVLPLAPYMVASPPHERPTELCPMTTLPASFEILLERIAGALDRLPPPPAPPVDLDAADAFVFFAEDNRLVPVPKV